MDNDAFVVVTWPDNQVYMEQPGWRENSYLISYGPLLQEYGKSTYLVRRDWKTVIDEAANAYYNSQYGLDHGKEE